MTPAYQGQETIGKSLSHHPQQGAQIRSHSSITVRCSAGRIDTSEQSSANKSPQISEAQYRLRVASHFEVLAAFQTQWVHRTALRIAGFAACLRERGIAVNLPSTRAGTSGFVLSES